MRSRCGTCWVLCCLLAGVLDVAEAGSLTKAIDLDRDGIDEIIVTSAGKTTVHNADGSLRYVRESESAPQRDVPQDQPGWPIVTGGVFRASPALADLDHDGIDEIIVGSCDEKLYVFSAYGDTLPGWPQPVDGDIYSSPAVADIDGDDELEIIVGSWWSKVYAWEWNGTAVAGQWPRDVFGRVAASPAIGDIDDDGDLEIVIASYYGAEGVVYGLESNGADASGWPQTLPSSILATPALADIDEDGRLEVVIGTGTSREVYAFNGEDASVVDGWPVTTYGEIRSSAAIGDIDQDTHLEIILGDSYWGGHAWVFEADGQVAEGWPLDVQNNVVGSPSLADLDDDGDLEIVIPSSIFVGSPYTSKLWVFHHDAAGFGEWPVAFPASDERAEGNPAVVEMDGDGELEFVLGTGNGGLINENWYAFNLDTTSLDGYPMVGEDIYASAAAGDIDNDGKLEVAVGSWGDHAMHCWEQGADSYDAALMPWPMYHHDLRNTGLYGVEVPTGIEQVQPLDTIGAGSCQTGPNPFRGFTTIRYSVPRAGHVYLSIHDATGRRLKMLVNDILPSGEHEAVWRGRDSRGARLGSGAYYYRLRSFAGESGGKLILQR